MKAWRLGWQTPPIGRFVDVPGGRVHLLETGPRNAPPVVLLHGASGNLRDMAASLMPELSGHARVIAMDRPGMGHSDPIGPAPWRLAAQGAALRAALARIGVHRATLVGHSFSGALVLEWALTAPETVAGLVVLSGASMDWGGALSGHYKISTLPVLGGLMATAVPFAVGEAKVARSVACIFAPQAVPEGYVAKAGVDLALRPAIFRHNARAIAALHGQITANAPRYCQIRCPVEVVHGTADDVVPAEVHARPLSACLPDARLTLLDGVGHMPHWVAREAVARRVLGALAHAA